MLYVPSTCCTDINATAEFVPITSESVFCHRLYSITNGSVCLGSSSGIKRQTYETLGHGRSRGTSFIHFGFVVAGVYGFKFKTFIMKHTLLGPPPTNYT